ncbi:hypothetical protein K431DRAFT_285711 [Polychaeton citri CBS 116435]|uniref:C2H2-type domain-containing protein n=1 Tax=Polychaeton citri CBS 116435 TaxID=1314669 RepID=A0A9P4Q7C0_9PEZI|nr:hypothetical protein K431DRAFT_285711 [Polychaeton citri CBS 116435]
MMSPAVADAGSSSYQPFQCSVCQSRFTRHENLKRHAALHSRSKDETSISCNLCGVTFSRRDLHHRHMKRKHPEQRDSRAVKRPRRDSAAATGWEDGWTSQGDRATSTSPEGGRHDLTPQATGDKEEVEMDSLAWRAFGQRQLEQDSRTEQADCDDNLASTSTSAGDKCSPDVSDTPTQHSMAEARYMGHLVQEAHDLEQNLNLEASLLEASYQFGSPLFPTNTSQSTSSRPDSDSGNFSQCIPDGLSPRDLPYLQGDWFPSPSQVTRGFDLYFAHVSEFLPFLHRPTFNPIHTPPRLTLGILCLGYQYGDDPDYGEQAGSGARLSLRCFHRARVSMALDGGNTDDQAHSIGIVQTYLLLQICAMMYLCGKDSSYGPKMHSEMISLARSGGLMQPILIEPATTGDLEALWREFIKAESHKRTILAIHQIDSLWYQFLSVPRSLSHLEIKHELPCPEDCWMASSSSQWAHRQLLQRRSTPSVQYADAVRCFLAPEPDVSALPAFDPYGAINIAQFLLSSAREISGWSTMTGRLSFERFDSLRSSLVALDPFIRPNAELAKTTHAVSCEATWQMAMIELQMWSPSHTCGVVQENLDAALSQSTYLTSSCELPFEIDTAKTIQPHIDWFLLHLEETLVPDREPPWIALYAYKVFLIAWHFVRAGLANAMRVVGVPDGDIEGAIAWAMKVFQRRQQLQLGKLIINCLAVLSK